MDSFIEMPKFYFSKLGCWPKEKSKWSKIYNVSALFTTYMISYLFLGSLAIEIYVNFNDLNAVTEAFFVLLTQLTFIMKFTFFTLKQNQFVKLLKEIKKPVFSSYLPEQNSFMENWSNFANLYLRLFFRLCLLCLMLFAIPPLIPSSGNSTLPFKGWFPFEINNFIKKTIAYIFQMISVGTLVVANVNLDCLPCVFMNIGCAQIEILKDSLEKVVERTEKSAGKINQTNRKKFYAEIGDNYVEMLDKDLDKMVQKKLGECVYHHTAILRLFTQIQDVFSYAMFSQFVAVVATLCFSGFQLAVIPPNSFMYYTVISYMMTIVMEIALYCWNGNYVIEQSSSIGNSCYNIEWYRCSTKVRKTIFIIMERTKIQIILNAGKFFVVSILTLTTILRSSYSYFAVLREVYGE